MSVSEWKAREKEQRRSDIVEVAEKLFASRGYESVSMDDIAREINLGKATLYRYFRSKEALFFIVVLRGVRFQHSLLTEGLKNAKTGAEQLSAIGNATYEFKKRYPQYTPIMSYYYSGRFNLCNPLNNDHLSSQLSIEIRHGKKVKMTDGDIIEEITRLQAEDFETACSAITLGREDETVQQGMDPAELAILLSLLSSSLISLSPVTKCLLNYKGIAPDRFIADSQDVINQKLLYTEPAARQSRRSG